MNSLAKIFSFLAILFVVFQGVFALQLSIPDEVRVSSEGKLRFDVSNNSLEAKNLIVEFYTPAEYSISAPRRIYPGSTETVVITIKNYSQNLNVMNSKLVVRLGNEVQEKNIRVVFEPVSQSDLIGLFSFSAFFLSVSSFSVLEWIGFIVLVIVAAFLLVMLAARLFNRA